MHEVVEDNRDNQRAEDEEERIGHGKHNLQSEIEEFRTIRLQHLSDRIGVTKVLLAMKNLEELKVTGAAFAAPIHDPSSTR